jgi:hypothetical protein
MLHIKSIYTKVLAAGQILMMFLALSACSNEDNPIGSDGSTSKVSGRISASGAMPKELSKTGYSEYSNVSIQGAVVTLAQVQADGSLKTVSKQNVQTDVNGKFVAETDLNGAKNLIVIAEQGAVKWKAIVSASVRNGFTVYAPPLNEESSEEADLYIKVVGTGYSNEVSDSDIKAFLDQETAVKIRGNADSETKFINAVRAKAQAMFQASSNSYFGFSSAQIQAFTEAKAEAIAKLDEDAYMSGDSETEKEDNFKSYEGNVVSACASKNISATAYAELMRIGLSAFSNASASMEAQARLALSKSLYKRYAVVLGFAMNQQFQAAGASNAQINSMAAAGVTLYNSIKTASDVNQINDAFVQYHSAAKVQLQAALAAYATLLETLDLTVNASGGAKALLTASLNLGASVDLIINSYVNFYNSLKTSVQTALTGASAAQVSAASHVLILANMN